MPPEALTPGGWPKALLREALAGLLPDEVRWRPWAVPHELLYVNVLCAGCRARECPVVGHPCLKGVHVDEVLGAVERLVANQAVAA